MVYFISAWYDGNNWREREQVWYIAKHITEFDDTIKQVQLFSRNKLYPYKIILLSHAPNFRHFLHRQSIFRADYWSVFDQMQCITSRTQRPFSYHDIQWPDDVEFIASHFAVIVRRKGEKFAQIEFGDDGNMILVKLFDNNQISRINHYDDRGFVSMTEMYKDGKPFYEQYMNEDRVWKFNRYVEDGHVDINPLNNFFLWPEGEKEFKKLRYDSIEEMIEEVLVRYVNRTDDDAIFCVAMHSLHTDLWARLLRRRKTILSFYETRFSLVKNEVMEQFLRDAGYIVTATREDGDKIRSVMGQSYPRMTSITPYDSRVDDGISMEFPYQNILVMSDGVPKERFDEICDELVKYVIQHHKTKVNFYTTSLDYLRVNELKTIANELNEQVNANSEVKGEYFVVARCLEAMETNRKLRETRLLVDLQDVPNQFLQISAISMGVPQITLKETQYIKNGRNGHVLEAVQELNEWIAYYLKDLSNWNHARVQSYEMGAEFTTSEIQRQWTEVIRHVENDWS